MNPPLPLPLLVPLLVLGLFLGLITSWRSTRGLAASRRGLLLGMRVILLGSLSIILLNPGKWVRPTDQAQRPWIVLTDASASMSRKTGDSTRFANANQITHDITKAAKAADVPLRLHAFDSALQPATEQLPQQATGKGSLILAAIDHAFRDASAAGESPAGLIVLSDGRQTTTTTPEDLAALSLRAHSRQTPVHTIAVGSGEPDADIALRTSRSSMHVFTGQSVRIPVVLESTGLGSLRSDVILRDSSGKEISRKTLDLQDGKPQSMTFEVPAPASSTRWSVHVAIMENEARSGNNQADVSIHVLTSKTRVFLAEGAPYWDSKFLAQLLRQQKHMEVHSIHRLSEQRFFRIDSGDAAPSETTQAVFPETIEEMARYDLIIFGKNIDAFLTPARLDALRSYVRDHGGAVLFSRGKPTTTDIAGLEPLEPVTWAAQQLSDFRFTPHAEGEAAGLFGNALPSPSASVWNALPTLKDGRAISSVKPFTRILAEGVSPSSQSGKLPALVVRRYGQGVTGLVNGDGLWKWDFYPEARELGNMYEDFWSQLIQWMASYSEFLPGQDFSLHSSSTQGLVGQPITLSMSYRGSIPAPQPQLKLICENNEPQVLTPALSTDASGRARWQATFTPGNAGLWRISLTDPRANAAPTPQVELNVPAPPQESDDLTPDPSFLAQISETTGGQTIDSSQIESFLKTHLHSRPPATLESGAVWQPAWNHVFIAIGLAFLPASEWFLRRRQGLA